MTSILYQQAILNLPMTLTLPKRSALYKAKETLDVEALTAVHASFCAAVGYDADERGRKKAFKDVVAVRAFFPTQHDSNIVLAMAAWFALICALDDEGERLQHGAAKAAMGDGITVFRDLGPGNGSTDPGAMTRARKISLAFIQHVREFLPGPVLAGVADSIVQYLEGICVEMEWRRLREEDPSAVSEQSYLEMCFLTGGLEAFRFMLHHAFCPSGIPEAFQPALETIFQNGNMAVRMENDIFGAKKDMADGNPSNYIGVLCHNGVGFADAVAKAAVIHNIAVQNAFDAFESIVASEKAGDQVKNLARALLGAIEGHFKWASASQRYKV